jgi:DNA end-binding protein Ku
MAPRARKPPRAAAKKAPEAPAAAETRRALWTGELRLSLVAVPVRLHAAVKSGARLSFHQIHKPSGKRIRYEKVAPGIGPVELGDIVKGYETSRGHYVLLDDADIDSVRLEAKRTFDLVQFVDHCEIDPIYFDHPYYVTPDGELAHDAYRVLRDALRRTRKVGLGQIVMRGREYIAALKPCGAGLLAETLRFADEVRTASSVFTGIDDGRKDASEELLGLAEELIQRKSAPFEASAFKDRYTEALRALIDAKAARRPPLLIDDDAGPPAGGAQIIDLVAALKKSVNALEGDKAPARPAKPPSRRARRG